jgi:hypothetical protein
MLPQSKLLAGKEKIAVSKGSCPRGDFLFIYFPLLKNEQHFITLPFTTLNRISYVIWEFRDTIDRKKKLNIYVLRSIKNNKELRGK